MQRDPERGRRITPRVTRAVTAVMVVGLMSGCSSDDSAQAERWRQNYCARLGAWQDVRVAMAADAESTEPGDEGMDPSPELDNAGIAGHAAIVAAKVLDREGLDRAGGHILDDTVMAVGGDPGAEARATSYCDASGFETLVG
ncbi:hypothetical protein ACFCYB_24950 [Streptomyces sp. NPDC056309]|uniref:hypothetical protein n=1 Tax=unclassified Streptomyces TaxID=2593676 RepID=UPI0035E31E1D